MELTYHLMAPIMVFLSTIVSQQCLCQMSGEEGQSVNIGEGNYSIFHLFLRSLNDMFSVARCMSCLDEVLNFTLLQELSASIQLTCKLTCNLQRHPKHSNPM